MYSRELNPWAKNEAPWAKTATRMQSPMTSRGLGPEDFQAMKLQSATPREFTRRHTCTQKFFEFFTFYAENREIIMVIFQKRFG